MVLRTLAEQLRAWSADDLARLLDARPDLALPAPTDSAQLAARATTRTSLLRALDQLDLLQLGVVEAVASAAPLDADAVAALVKAREIGPTLDLLAARVLIWDDGRGLRTPSQLTELVGLPPGPAAESIASLIDELDPAARAMLDHLDDTGADGTLDLVPQGVTRDTARTPAEQLLARGLLTARDARHVTIPWSVRLHLHGGRSTREALDVLPEVPLSELDEHRVDAVAAEAAVQAVHRVEVLLDSWGTRPPAALRGGGLGVRDLRAATVLLGADPTEVALLVETAAAAGLVALGSTESLDAAWLPTERYDVWLAGDTGARWAVLARTWLDNPRDAAVIGQRVAGKTVNALGEGLERPWLSALRRELLAVLAEMPAGRVLAAATGVPGVAARLRWRRPRRPASQLAAVDPLLREAAQLGVIGAGALGAPARALLDGGDAAATLTALLPAPVDHVLLQADLTAIAPGPLEGDLARRLALLADVESRGGATVYRFSDGSVRRAFDAGWSAAEVHTFLDEVSRTPVPQGLAYVVDDVARRFGVLRAGHAESFLRSDDEVALTALVHDPAAASLRLRRIAPTVVVSDVPIATLLPRLRELGLAPVVEAADGTVRVARPDVHRARSPRGRSEAAASARAGARTAAVVAAIRAGDMAATARPARGPVSGPADIVTLLRASSESREQVLIAYVGSDGTLAQRLVSPIRVEGGTLTAHDARADTERTFAIHRITSAQVSQPGL